MIISHWLHPLFNESLTDNRQATTFSFIDSVIDWFFIYRFNLLGTHLKPHQVENKETDFFDINIMIQALFIHDLLPGRHSAVGAVLNKDTDSNSQGSKTDNSTFWTFHFWCFSYCPLNSLPSINLLSWIVARL